MKRQEAYWPLILLLAIIKFVLPLFQQDALYELAAGFSVMNSAEELKEEKKQFSR